MRYSIVCKFLAVLLCAAAFFAMAVGAGGMLGLEAIGLYDQSVEELHSTQLEQMRSELAYGLVQRYASVELGGCPEQATREFYGLAELDNALWNGQLQFEITTEDGQLLATNVTQSGWRGKAELVPVEETTYLRLEELPIEPLEPLEPDQGPLEPEQTEEQAQESLSSQEAEGLQETALPELPAKEGHSQLTEPPLTEEPISPAPKPEGFEWEFYDRDLQAVRTVLLSKIPLNHCQVKLYTTPDILGVAGGWQLLRAVWPHRGELLKLAGLGAAVFAVTFVYLCCAAGRKPGKTEVDASGLNRVSLDLYGLVVLLSGAGVAYHGPRIIYYLLEDNPQTALLVGGILCGGLCLLLVGFFFALAAQVKMPGHFWIKNTLVGWSFVLLLWLGKKLIAFLKWIWSWLWPGTRRLFRALWKLVCFFWRCTVKAVKGIFSLLRAFLCRCGRGIARLIGLLPLIWQWLVGGLAMVVVLAVTLTADNWLAVLMGIALLLGLILYGAYAFGTLLGSAKHMSRGELDVPVDDRLLIGCFREFGEELEGVNNAVKTAAQKQLKSERMKTELITNVSHDIKTPLTSIINYLDLMGRPHTEEEQELYLEVLGRQSQRLKKLIDDLMEMSKASTGNMPVDLTSVDAVEAVNQALGEFADKLARAELTPVFHQPKEPVRMQADGRLVWRVMSNLLGNAVKYALPGTRLYLDVTRLEGKVMISIKNISREALNVAADELMERFVRGDASRNTEGSGLGLNIARSLMELQRGSLQLLVDGDLFKATLVFPETA